MHRVSSVGILALLLLCATPCAEANSKAKIIDKVIQFGNKWADKLGPGGTNGPWADKYTKLIQESKWRVQKGAETIADQIIHGFESNTEEVPKEIRRDWYLWDASDHIQQASTSQRGGSVTVRGGRLG